MVHRCKEMKKDTEVKTLLFAASFFLLFLSVFLLLPDEDTKCRKRLGSSLVASFSSILISASFFFLLSSVFLLLPDEDTKCRNRLFVSFSSIVVHW